MQYIYTQYDIEGDIYLFTFYLFSLLYSFVCLFACLLFAVEK